MAIKFLNKTDKIATVQIRYGQNKMAEANNILGTETLQYNDLSKEYDPPVHWRRSYNAVSVNAVWTDWISEFDDKNKTITFKDPE